MKVLFDHHLPFVMAHGGFQIQIEQTKIALETLGIEVEWLRWWDAAQTGDLIHFFGRPDPAHIDFAHEKGMRYVMMELLTSQGSRTTGKLEVQRLVNVVLRSVLPPVYQAHFGWASYQKADAILALTHWESRLMQWLYNAPADKLHIVSNGVEEIFFASPDEAATSRLEKKWLICTATITERKRVVELAEAAVAAETPLWVLGKPYSPADPYYLRFLEIVQNSAPLIRYEGAVGDRTQLAQIYRDARGFVLLSTMESQSLSALESAASGVPLLLSELPWATETFGSNATYAPISATPETAKILKEFYKRPTPPLAPKPKSWKQVAQELLEVYRGVLSKNG